LAEKVIDLICENCDKEFKRRLAEHVRNQRKGRRVFCGHSCNSTWMNTHGKRNPKGNPETLRAGNRRDEYTPFRYYQLHCRQRKRKEYNLDLPYLKELWEKQGGQCPLTGWNLELPINTRGFYGARPKNASIDRINGSLGYIKGNVRFVALIANLARGMWGDEAVKTFARAVVAWG